MKYIISAKDIALLRKGDSNAADKIGQIIAAHEGQAKVRKLTAFTLLDAIRDAEEKLFTLSTKQDAIGTWIDVDVNAQSFPSAYKYTPESTQFMAVLTASGWAVKDIGRYSCNAPTKRIQFTFTDATKAHMVEYLRYMA